MGNSASSLSPNVQLESTKDQTDARKIKYGHPPQIKTRKKNKNASHKRQSRKPSHALHSLYPYLTYYKSLNHFCQPSNTLQLIANLISSYIPNAQIIKNKTFELPIYIEYNPQSTGSQTLPNNLILCGSSWNGLIYLLSAVNNTLAHPHWYMIDEYNRHKSKQITMNDFPSKHSLKFDTRLCCVVSHIVRFNFNIVDMEYISSIHEPMIIDAIILCNAQLNTVYGYSLIKRGLFVITKFEESEPNLLYNYETNQYEIQSFADGFCDEKVVKIWRQNLDCLLLTNKLRLFGIKITAKLVFKMSEICQFNKDVKIGKYCDCWYDIQSGHLLLICKSAKDVMFKVYTLDGKIYNLFMPKTLRALLNKYYLCAKKTFLFSHKPSKSLLLMFGDYIVQFRVCFAQLCLTQLNIGKIMEFDLLSMDVINEIESGGIVMKSSAIQFGDSYDMYSEDILKLFMQIKRGNKARESKGKHGKLSICDFILGFDELRSCLIINLNECKKELQTLYKFKIFVMSVNDLDVKWRRVIGVKTK